LPPSADSWSLTTLSRTNVSWALQPSPEAGTVILNITLYDLSNFT
jgi:hypothetical protein